MFQNKEIKQLQEKIDELSEKIDKISQKQDSQYTDLMLLLKDTKDVANSLSEEYEGTFDENDDMYDDALQVVTEAGKASTSYLQRKLGIGYSRACHLMDLLETRAVIGPTNGSKPREVFVKKSE